MSSQSLPFGICSSVSGVAWPLGNNKESKVTEEAYFRIIGKRVNHDAGIGNVPTGPARLNIAELDAVWRFSLLYAFPSGVTCH